MVNACTDGRSHGANNDVVGRRGVDNPRSLQDASEIASTLAHEINNILSPMTARAYLAQGKDTEKAQTQLIDTVIEQAERGAKMCDHVLRFARRQEPRRRPIPIEQPIGAALLMAARELQNAQIDTTGYHCTGGGYVNADASQLAQVFLNLIVNACDAMPDGGQLSISTIHVSEEDGPGEVVVTVSDAGTGIRPDDLPRIFDPFVSTKASSGGSQAAGIGLGLSVARRIVNAHRGRLTVQSEVGIGSTFEVRLAGLREACR